MDIIKKNQTEFEEEIFNEIKSIFKNFNRKLEQKEKCIYDVENTAFKIIQSYRNKEKNLRE